jgi:hypothetical protein
MSRDLEAFLSDITWFFREKEEIKIIGERAFQCSNEFNHKFPMLTKLLKKARITTIDYMEKRYELFGWTNYDSNTLGWLCFEPLAKENIEKRLHPDHLLLLQNFGGITERWNEPDSWLCNLNFAFPYENTEFGFDGWEVPFKEYCEEEGVEVKISPEEYITFTQEANGNITMYHLNSGEVIMYAHDHCFDHIYPLDDYPDYSLYRIKNCNNFADWVESVAKQWLSNIK